MNNTDDFIKLVKHPVKFRMFLLMKLPSAFFCGVRVQQISKEKAEVTVPYKWLSQNPFKSTYFACLAMAAEMSTGLLAMANTYKNKPSISMLVTGLQATYHKKAVGITTFTCEDGIAISNTVAEVIQSGEGRSFKARSVGRNKDGEIVAEFFIEWSFKRK
ncbi:MAG: DUF4442 domain-containing protein [Bacteroidota bacterium]